MSVAVRPIDDQPLPLEARHRWVVLLAQVGQLAHAIADTDFVPRALRGNEAAIVAAILYGDEVGLSPMQSLSKVSVIDGRPSIAAEAQRALILAAGHQIWFEDLTTTKATWAGRRAGADIVQRVTWTMDDAKRAGIAGRQNWRTYPRAMLSARASAELARAVFADVIGGLAATEELEDPGSVEAAGMPGVAETPAAQAASGTPVRRRRTNPAAVIAPTAAAAAPPPGPPEPPLPDDYPLPEPAKITDPQMRMLMGLFRKVGLEDREARLAWTNERLQRLFERTVESASELTDAEASALIKALQKTPPPEPAAPAAEAADQPPLDADPVSNDRVQMITWARREAGVTDAWMRAQLEQLGLRDLPEKIGADTLKRLSRSEAIVLSDAISDELDARASDE